MNGDQLVATDHRWAVQTPRLRALDLDFAVRCTDPVIGRYLLEVLSPFAVGGDAREVWSVVVSGERRHLSEVWVGDELSGRRRSAHRLVSHVLWRVNQEAIQRSSRHYVLFHASGAVHDGRAVVFPAAMEAGKTTLVAGLVRRGMQYLTDEAVAVDPATLLAHPFPKALSIDPGSWEVLADFRPGLDPEAEHLAAEQWHVPVEHVRPGSIAEAAPIDFVVFPRYSPGGPTELTSISRAEAFLALRENSFNLAHHGTRGFFAITEAIRRSQCYRLAVSDLDRACDVLVDLVTR